MGLLATDLIFHFPFLLSFYVGMESSGIHETTRLGLAEIDRRVRGGERVFDAGCGSGILSVTDWDREQRVWRGGPALALSPQCQL